VVLTGASQSGKSTLAQWGDALTKRPCLTLDDLETRQQAAEAPQDLLERCPDLPLDEVQREPGLLLAAEALVDQNRPR
jgi:hypothetical protein